MCVSVVLQGLVRMSAAAVFWSPSEAKTLCLTAGCIWAITTMCVTAVIAIFTCVYLEDNSRQVEYYALNFLCSFSETFPRFQLHYPKRSPHWVPGLCYYKVSLYVLWLLCEFSCSPLWFSFLLYVLLSHFHLDHCGALPYMSEMVGYDGPIYMTHPTKAICPILLEDFRKITVDKKGETNFFTSQMIKDCMKKVVPLNLHQTVQVKLVVCELNFNLQ